MLSTALPETGYRAWRILRSLIQGGSASIDYLLMRDFIRISVTLGVLGSLLAGLAPAAEIRGSLELLNRKGTRPARGVDPRDAVIWWEPDEKEEVDPIEGGAVMVTAEKEFEPRVLVITRGTTVRFPNSDPILHNVFSVSGDNRFDLGLYRKGPGKSFVFEYDGVVRVFCNVHHSMVAYVVVLDTPHFVRADKQGRFLLPELAEGSGNLVVWHERSKTPLRQELSLPYDGALEVSLNMTRARVPKHLNKAGRSYARLSDDYQ